MALIPTVTKKSVTRQMPKLWNITLNMILTDGSVEVLNKDYSVKYRTGDDISLKTDLFIKQMQKDIDNYKSEQAIFTNAQLDTAITTVQEGLVV